MKKDEGSLKKDFSIFEKHPELVYLDSTATTQKPKQVVQTMQDLLQMIMLQSIVELLFKS